MLRRLALPIAALSLAGGGVALAATPASASNITLSSTCVGQKPKVVPLAPYSCTAKKIIDGITFTGVLSENEDGFLIVDFYIEHARLVGTPIHITSHKGTSGSGQEETDPNGAILAGQTHSRLTIGQALCGQIDVKVIDFTHGNGNYRLMGPYVNNKTCLPAPPTTTTTTVPVTSPPTTAPPVPTTAGHPHTTTPPEATVIRTVPKTSHPLPPTGSSSTLVVTLGLLLVLAGLILLTVRRRNARLS